MITIRNRNRNRNRNRIYALRAACICTPRLSASLTSDSAKQEHLPH
ncbi:MAG: hypothetical protein L7S57_10625 [Luminiphilus sp.]|nr:hypothetical protein [Luminiphilus sp.]